MSNQDFPWIELIINSWDDFDQKVMKLSHRKWLFRGHSDASWGLKTSLDRLFVDIQPLIQMHKGRKRKFAKDTHERLLINNFQRNAHLYLSTLPAKSDKLEWLAIMQHYGAPTRLLDVTLSPYIAAYFALEKGHTDCCVFAFNHSELRAIDSKALPHKEYLKIVFKNMKGIDSFIIAYDPKLSNERLVSQQSLFLVPSTNYEPFQKLLSEYRLGGDACIKFIIPAALRFEGLERLRRMNITSASLFPGIDGFCRSLRFQILETTQSLKSLA